MPQRDYAHDYAHDYTSQDRRVFDAHLHIIDPRFPLTANAGYLPPTFTVDDYLHRTAHLNIVGGAVVSGSFHGFDQEGLLHALRRLGPGFVGVTQIPATATGAQILALHDAGVRAVRFNVRRGGSETLDHLDTLARHVHELAGWHVELYVDAGDLPDLAPTLLALPAVSIDHLGLSTDGLPHLLQLVERGVRVKATGYSPLRHPVSSVAIGEFGWIQIANFLVTGALLLAFAFGLRPALRRCGGGIWAPRLIGLIGTGLVGAGVFVADLISGYPPGTPMVPDETTRTIHGTAHDVFSAPLFLGLPVACAVVAYRFAASGHRAGRSILPPPPSRS